MADQAIFCLTGKRGKGKKSDDPMYVHIYGVINVSVSIGVFSDAMGSYLSSMECFRDKPI